MIHAIFFDIDGTLLDRHTHLCPESTRQALQQLQREGIKLFIATGRNPLDLTKDEILQDTRCVFDAYLTCNGQYCYNQKGILYENTLPKSTLEKLMTLYGKDPWPMLVFRPDGRFAIGDGQDPRFLTANQAFDVKDMVFTDIRTALNGEVLQILCYQQEGELPDPVKELPQVKKIRWHPCGYDMVPSNGGKKDAIQKILAIYGFSAQEAMAFGDGENDADMLSAVGIGVAMGNGCKAAKDAATYVTTEIYADGVARALAHFGLL